jgi:uncharacterized membrane protein
LISFSIPASVFAQSTNQALKKIPPALLKQDFLELRDTLQKMHPGLYRYRSKSAMDHIFDSCFMTIRDSMSVAGFYALTSFVVAAMEDGHSNCRLSREAINDYMRDVKVFPAMVFFIHNKAFIFCCKQNDELAEAELLSIDGHPLDEVVQRLFCYIPSDGSIQSRKNWEMPESFQLLYSIVYGTKDSFNIVCKTKTGERRTVVLMADRMNNFVCPAPFHRPDKYLELSYTGDNIAVLTLRSFFDGFLQQTHENFSRFLDSALLQPQIRMAVLASSNNRGIFIGEECGGGYYGNTSGDEQIVTLPNTQIGCRIPLVKYTMAVKPAKYKDRGVLPDYPIYTTISDLVENTDGQLVYALKIATKN